MSPGCNGDGAKFAYWFRASCSRTSDPLSSFAEPEYAGSVRIRDHHRHLHEMVLAGYPAAGRGADGSRSLARHAKFPAPTCDRTAVAAGIEGVELTHSGAPYAWKYARGGRLEATSALAVVRDRLHRRSRKVAAAGDAFNDVAMLTWAGTERLAPANARTEGHRARRPNSAHEQTRTAWRAISKNWLRALVQLLTALGPVPIPTPQSVMNSEKTRSKRSG
ncbi:unnamed protein product, partial [Mesorhabditis spiculigera]